MGFLATTTSFSELIPNWLSGNTTTSDALGTNILTRHIDRAEGLVMAAASREYDSAVFTTTNYPPLLRSLAEDIACLFAMRGATTQDAQIKNENVAMFKGSYDMVQEILQGKQTLALAYTSGAQVPRRTGSLFLSSSEGYTPIFGLDDATLWDRDADEVDDQEDARQ